MKSIKIFATVGAIALLGMTGLTSCNQKNGPVDPITGDYKGETVKTEFLINIADNAAGKANRWNMPGATVQNDLDGDKDYREHFRGMDSIRLIPYAGDYTARIGKTIVLSPIELGTTGLPQKSSSKLYANVAIPLGTERFLFYGKAIDNAKGTAISSVSDKHKFGILEMAGLWSTGNAQKEGVSFSPVPIYTYTEDDPKATAICAYLKAIADVANWSSTSAGIQQLRTDMLTVESGSSYAVQEMVEDMYNSLERYQEMQVIPDDNVTAIMNVIKTKVTGYDAGSEGNRELTLVSDLAGYPGNINLPEGAARIHWNGTSFDVVNNSNIGTNLTTNLSSYVYPANLQYFAQSTLVTSNKSEAAAYNDPDLYWKDILALYDADVKVTSSTRSVAIKDTIQYGVAQLEATVKLGDGSLNDSKTVSAGTAQINVNGTTGHEIMWNGILIGDQRPVDYKFENEEGTGTAYTVYDNYMNGQSDINDPVELSTSPVTNYTLLLSTKNNSSETHTVYVALELVNNAGDFFGVNEQLIPDGGTFYLVGALNVGSATRTANPHLWNIFYKDFVTKANFTITSLENAYYTIPDLRSSNLELGFSVDLVWQEGLSFDINL